jgi:hypothetical protein
MFDHLEGNRDLRRIYMPPDYTSFLRRTSTRRRRGPLARRRRPAVSGPTPVDAPPGTPDDDEGVSR